MSKADEQQLLAQHALDGLEGLDGLENDSDDAGEPGGDKSMFNPPYDLLRAAAAAAKQAANGDNKEEKAEEADNTAKNSLAPPPAPQENNKGLQVTRAKKAQKGKGRVKIDIPAAKVEEHAFVMKKPPKQEAPKVEEYDEENEEDQEPSRLLMALSSLFGLLGSGVKRVLQLVLGLVSLLVMCVCVLTPLLLGVPLYGALVYLLATHVVSGVEDGASTGHRLNYLMRWHAFTVLPSAVAFLLTYRKDERHERFCTLSCQQALLLIVGTVLMTTHCCAEMMSWVGALIAVYVMYSFLHYASLMWGSEKMQCIAGSPCKATVAGLVVYNVVMVSCQYWGYLLPEEAMEEESRESAGAYWQFAGGFGSQSGMATHCPSTA